MSSGLDASKLPVVPPASWSPASREISLRPVVVLAAASVGVLVLAGGLVFWPVVTVVAVVSIVLAAWAIRSPSETASVAGFILLLLLCGYALLGKNFAKIGAGPVYVGELVLALLVPVTVVQIPWRSLLRERLILLLAGYALWCAARTIPYIDTYGYFALRDAAIWGYSIFALCVAGLLVRYNTLAWAVKAYGRLALVMPFWFSLVGIATLIWGKTALGRWLTETPVLKAGDVSVHLTGLAAYLSLGLHRSTPTHSRSLYLLQGLLWSLWALCVLLFGSQNRGGILGLSLGLLLLALLSRRGLGLSAVIASFVLLAGFLALDVEFDIGTNRKVSPAQLAKNLRTVMGDPELVYEGTRQWRLKWWSKIWSYTVGGEYFWTGKGFGVNLADDDGFQTDPTYRSLRSPHNGHMTILARAGVPGFAMWAALVAGFWVSLLGCYLRTKRQGRLWESKAVLWVMVYATASLANAAFDVYLEGPQGGIWFWVLFGLGLAMKVRFSEQRPRSGLESAQRP